MPEPDPEPAEAAEKGQGVDESKTNDDDISGAESKSTVSASDPQSVRLEEAALMSEERRPALGMDEVSCRTCRYLDFQGELRTDAEGGECRRHAPVPGANQIASWPRVTWAGWCGEWESGVSDEDMVKMARAIADEQVDGSASGFLKSAPAKPES
ncbi:MAG: hypothetical protein P1U58_06760 [Verrucomicrobiales bacterium]|nr:hypothetical protein [Verrucomicrobiales bacterium]